MGHTRLPIPRRAPRAFAVLLFVFASCAANSRHSASDELGASNPPAGTAPDAQPQAGQQAGPDAVQSAGRHAGQYAGMDRDMDLDFDPERCRSEFAPDDLAGFAQEFLAAVASLQLTVDANPVRQFLADPEGRGFRERAALEECDERRMSEFAASTDPWIRELARPMATLLADARDAETKAGEIFQRTDWNSIGNADARANRWRQIRPSTLALSHRGSVFAGSLVAVLRKDGRIELGPGALRISPDGRKTALRHRGRLTDLSIMVELGIDPGAPLSKAVRMVVKWLAKYST